MSVVWTDAAIADLRRLWAEKVRCALISEQLQRDHGLAITRNAVIGKARRLALMSRKPIRKVPKRVTRPRPPAPERASTTVNGVPMQMPIEPVPPPADAALGSLLSLRAGMCCFPVGDPKAAGFGFCGAASKPGSPYCAWHHGIAYVPLNPASKRRRQNRVERLARVLT